MKIVLACEIFPPDIGGPATYAAQLGEALQSVGHEVLVISYGELRSNFSFPVKLVSRKIPFLLRQVVYFFKLFLLSNGAGLIYAQGPSVGPAAIWTRRLRKMPVVVKFVGDQSWQQIRMKGSTVGFETYMSEYGKRWYDVKTFWIQRWQKFSILCANCVIVPSLYLKNIVTQYLGADKKGVMVIPNGVEVSGMDAFRRIHPNRSIGTQDDKLRDILYVGRFENWKGLDVLIDTLRLLPSDFTLTLVGDGSEIDKLRLQAASCKLQDRVRFVGRVPHNELSQYFANALCFVEGTQYEGMPHVVLESWSFGVPVVVSDFPANTELVRDGETGLAFKLGDAQDLADKILKLSSDQALYTRISVAAFEEHKKYDKNKIMKESIEFLKKIAND